MRILGNDGLGAEGRAAGLLAHPGGLGLDLFDHLGYLQHRDLVLFSLSGAVLVPILWPLR